MCEFQHIYALYMQYSQFLMDSGPCYVYIGLHGDNFVTEKLQGIIV